MEKDGTKTYTNYYNVPSKEEGIIGVEAFRKIIYQEIYPGIDIEFFISKDPNKPVEYNFILRPGSKIEDIKIKFSGAEVCLENNALKWTTRHGIMKEIIPDSWSGSDINKKSVEVNFVQLEEDVVGFETPTPLESVQTSLTIDPTPVREWATYFGGEDMDTADRAGLVADSEGNLLFAGVTRSHTNIATSGRPESLHESDSMRYLAKFDPDGNLIWSIYYGGYRGAGFYDLAMDSAENLIVVGATFSENNIATPGAHQTSLPNALNHGSGIMVKFDKDGNRIWGTYYGGQSTDYFLSIAVDAEDNIYGAGYTGSNDNIATAGALRNAGDLNVHFNTDAFIVKMNKDGVRQWGTYYGGIHHDNINSLVVDSAGNVIMAGDTSSLEGIATPGVYQEIYASGGYSWIDAFVAKISPTGELLWGTYFGGEDYDFGNSVAVDGNDNILLTGITRNHQNIASPGAHQETRANINNNMNAYLAKFNPYGQLSWSTYYGGENGSGGSAVKVTSGNDILLYGSTASETNISTPDAFQTSMAGNVDVFLAKFTAAGERIWGTYYGGESLDESHNIALAPDGVIYISGKTYSITGISTPGAHQEEKNEVKDAFLVKFKDCLSSFTFDVPAGACEGDDLILSASGATGYSWKGPNGFSSTKAAPIIPNATAAHSGTYYLSLSSGNGCDDSRSFEITILSAPVALPVTNLTDCEAVYNSGLSAGFDLSNVKSQVLGNQTGMEVSFFDEKGDQLKENFETPYINSIPHLETLKVRVFNPENPDCFAETSFDLFINGIPEIFSVEDIATCDHDSDGIAETDFTGLAQRISGNNSNVLVSYFDQNKNPIVLSPTGIFINSVPFRENITARATDSSTGCYSEINFNIIVDPAPVAHSLQDLHGCDDNGDGISEYFDVSGVAANVLQDQTGLEIKYFASDGSEISNFYSPYTNLQPFGQTVTVRLTNPDTGCFAETLLLLKISAAPHLNSPPTLYTCNEGDGFGSFDTANWTQEIIGNQTGLKNSYFDSNGSSLPFPLPSSYKNGVSHLETLTVKVEDELNPLCISETELQLVVNQKQEIDLEDSYSICGLAPFHELEIQESFDTWEWRSSDGSIISNSSKVILEEDGNYSLTVGTFQNEILCEEVHHFKLVRSALPAIKEVNFRDWSSHNYIEILTVGDANFEYCIDGVNYSDSNYFENVPGGIYNVYVRDKNGCGMDFREVVLIDYPNFFSPNNDGQNDFWKLHGFENQPEIFILIFDRYGKLLKRLSSHSAGWDGTFNGKPMPADDYWFSITLNSGRDYKTNFSLLR